MGQLQIINWFYEAILGSIVKCQAETRVWEKQNKGNITERNIKHEICLKIDFYIFFMLLLSIEVFKKKI